MTNPPGAAILRVFKSGRKHCARQANVGALS